MAEEQGSGMRAIMGKVGMGGGGGGYAHRGHLHLGGGLLWDLTHKVVQPVLCLQRDVVPGADVRAYAGPPQHRILTLNVSFKEKINTMIRT